MQWFTYTTKRQASCTYIVMHNASIKESCRGTDHRVTLRHCQCQETQQRVPTVSRDTAEGAYHVKRHCRGCLPCHETQQRVHTVSRDTAEGAYHVKRHCRECILCHETQQRVPTVSRDTAGGAYSVKRHCRECIPCQETLQGVPTVSRDTAEGAYRVKRHCRRFIPCFSCVMVRSCSTLLSQGSEAVRPAHAACSFRWATTEV